MKNLLERDEAIAIAREVMEELFTEGERDLAKGAEKVWNTLLITARNSAVDFEKNVINFPIAKKIDAYQNKKQVK